MYKSSRPINPANSSANRKKPFEDVVCGRTEIPSDWKKRIANKSKKSIQTQTTDELYNLQEAEVQTGRYTNIYQAQVEPKNTSTSLIEYIHNNQYKFTTNVTTSNKRNKVSTGTSTTDWVQQIEDGFVTVDCEVEREPHSKVEEETFIEYVDIKKHMGVQTEKQADYLPSNRDISEGKTESKTSDDNDGGKEDNNNTSSNNTFTEYAPITQPQRLLRFLEDVSPMMIQAINENNEVDAFEYLRHTTSSSVATNTLDTTSDPTSPSARNTNNSDNFELTYNKTTLWKCLTVDLEKKKVIFPDWTKAKHFPGIILKVTTTRNKERIYDIEYDDGSKYYGVREEYLRLLESSSRRSSNTTGAAGSKGRANNPSSAPNNASNTRVFEGMRVHCKVTSKSGISKYYLGRIVKVQGKSLYDVEIFETSRIESGVSIDDLIIGGLLEGQPVEARKPMKQVLQCTSSSWNATGSMLGVTYGKNDVYGWCDVPGALCCWNIFNKTLDPTSPDIIIDHSSCLMSVTFHPIIPSIVAIGSYNGELMIYDLLHPEKAFAISPVIEYSHKEPIIDIKWMKSSSSSSVTMNTNDLDSWNIITSSIDGRILFWNISNKLQLPYKGYLLSNKLSQNKVELMRNIRGSHSLMNSSITSLSLSSSSYITNYMSQSNNNFINLFTPKWMMVGEANGEIIRCQVPRLPNKVITPEVIKSYPLVEEVFSSLNKKEEPFGHQPHIGAVSCMDWSPFHRNLFLTGGADGVVKLFHILEQQPLYRWEPASASQLQVDAFQFISITSVKFSPHRPTVFAASGSNGMIYIYDLSENTTLPITILEANDQLASTLLQSSDNNGNNNTTKKSSLHNSSAIQSKNSIVSIAFNHKQRDLFAASDWYGKVFVWRLSWQLANRKSNEVQTLNSFAQSSMSSGSGSGSNQYN